MIQYSPTPDLMESEIQAALSALCLDPQAHRWRRPGWTREVKAAIGRIAQNHGYDWLASGATKPAWLYDGTAQERRGDILTKLPLALESEWHGWAEIKTDFEKLLASRVVHRVMIFSEGPRRHRAEEKISRLLDMIARFQLSSSGDRYLLACWYGKDGTAGDFLFRLHVV